MHLCTEQLVQSKTLPAVAFVQIKSYFKLLGSFSLILLQYISDGLQMYSENILQ